MATKEEREEQKKLEAELSQFLRRQAGKIKEQDAGRFSRSAASAAGRETLFLDQLKQALAKAFKGKFPEPQKARVKSKARTSRVLNLVISDTHYGSMVDAKENGHPYGPIEEARRTAHVFRQAAEYKRDHRDETILNLHVLGDIIQGQLHDPRDGAPLAEQVAAAMRILSQGLLYLSREFPRGVVVRCATGNHGRNTARHRDRATNQKFDSIETMVYTALKEVSRYLPNVTVLIDYPPEYYWEDFGAVGLGTHGDTVINPGYPGKSIDVAGISRQVDKINNARVMKDKKPLSLVVVGHVHVGSMTHLPGGTTVITNGCLLPPDSYARSIGIFETACGQWLWESVPGHAPGDARFITVDSAVDQDESLDKIIQPYAGL